LATEKVFMLWGLLVLLVPLAASAMRRSWTRRDQVFAAFCALVTFVLVAFIPRPAPWGLLLAVAATAAAGAIIVGAFLALSPASRPDARRLALVVAVMAAAGLGAIYLGDALALGWTPSMLVLALFAATPLLLARRGGRGQ
jgi:hypothetical protein